MGARDRRQAAVLARRRAYREERMAEKEYFWLKFPPWPEDENYDEALPNRAFNRLMEAIRWPQVVKGNRGHRQTMKRVLDIMLASCRTIKFSLTDPNTQEPRSVRRYEIPRTGIVLKFPAGDELEGGQVKKAWNLYVEAAGLPVEESEHMDELMEHAVTLTETAWHALQGQQPARPEGEAAETAAAPAP